MGLKIDHLTTLNLIALPHPVNHSFKANMAQSRMGSQSTELRKGWLSDWPKRSKVLIEKNCVCLYATQPYLYILRA